MSEYLMFSGRHRHRGGLKPANQAGRNFADASDAQQRHVAIDLIPEQGEGTLHAGFAGGDGCIQKRPADKDETGRRAPAP